MREAFRASRPFTTINRKRNNNMRNAIFSRLARTCQAAAIFCLVIAAQGLQAQAGPELGIRFANPAFDAASKRYTVDIELTSLHAPEIFFGMNLRFFYDASKLSFHAIDQFAPGQGVLLEAPLAYVGNDASGVKLLGLQRAAGYVNGALQNKDVQTPLKLEPGAWSKLCRATFDVPEEMWDETEFCPALIWDQRPFTGGGSLLPGSDGVLIAVREQDRDTRAETMVGTVSGQPMNWQYNRLEGMPFGYAVSKECISLAQTTSTEDPTQSVAGEYALFQNNPNPFDDLTTIEFILPYAQRAQIHLYTLQGERLEMIDGYYPAGRNKVLLERKGWMDRSGVVYYQLVAGDNNVTLVRKMNVVSR